ncbi:CHAT domain-containing protein [Streptomyces sp. NPDC005017]|uniref:CHAT domain-containing protein n=1 Tax=Streptomyces sp. NPDC005017 TaxID=3364706 RepID=UPI0036AB32AA
MTELRERVVGRLATAYGTGDPAPVRDREAVLDALALLREAAPSPEDPVDLEAVAAVFWTFWFRHQGPEDPEAAQNMSVGVAAFGFLCPRLPEEAGLPEPLKENFDPSDPSHEARFAHLVCSVHAEVALNGPPEEQASALDRALAWSDTALDFVRADDPVGFVELAVYAHDLWMCRFQSEADPDGLVTAARYGREVCARLAAEPALFDTDVARAAAAACLRTVVDSARLLGTPGVARVDRLIAALPDRIVTPETADGLESLRSLNAQPVTWPGERDLRVGAVIADAGVDERDASRIACGVRRLRAALADTPAGHPAHPAVTVALGRALAAFAQAREDADAALEATELLTSAGEMSAEHGEMVAAYREFEALTESGAPDAPERAGPLLGRLAELDRERADRVGRHIDLDLEVLSLSTGFVPDDSADERIGRYRAALAVLPADGPHRSAYVAVLAALTGLRAEALRGRAPARAGLLDVECRELTEETLATAPPGFPAADLLRRGLFEAALPVAALAVTADITHDEDLPDELRSVLAQLSRMADVRLDGPDHLDSDIAIIRELLDAADEDDPELRQHLAGALGSALSAGVAERPDPAVLEEVVQLLRYARAGSGEAPGAYDRALADALTMLSAGSFDAEGAREAAALLASMPGHAQPVPEGPVPYDGTAVTGVDREVLAARTEFHNALQNYILGHEPAQLERARRVAHRLREITRAAPADGQDRPWYDLMGDAYADLVETVGPGGPRPDLDDTVVEQCRRTFAACPAGHPMRPMVTMTLARVLMQRAATLRATGPERSRALLAEARGLHGILREATPEGSPIDLAGMVGTVADLVGRDRLPETANTPGPPRLPGTTGTDAPAPADTGPFGPLAAMLARLAGQPAPDGWNNPALPVWMRAHGEIAAAAGALGRGTPRIDLALTHLEAAVEAMAGLTDRGSDQTSAEHGLSTFEGDIRSVVELVLSAVELRDAPAKVSERMRVLEETVAALEGGRTADLDGLPALDHTVRGPEVDRTAELLERGRGLLLARRIEARADIGELHSAHPELAAEFERLTDTLDSRPAPDTGGATAGAAEWARLAGLRASNELDDLVRRIRTLPGFEGFLRPPTAEECKALAAEGPVVLLNHGRRHCHALVITPESVTALRLEAEAEETTDAARRLRDAVDAINAQGTERPSPLRLVAAGKEVRETLAWTWHRIVRPVLDSLGAAEPVRRHGVWPRVWWVPTGPFSALPLHAAECTAADCAEDGCGAALDAVVSSYAPGLQTLTYARARARRRDTAGPGGALLVAAPEDDLPGVAAAAAYAAGLLGARQPLIGPDATRASVLAALHDASWAHFGCHAATDPAEPSGALLHLPSGEPVSVLEICRVRPRAARLAFLAACGTARTAERLVDEAIHITSSFLLAGFPAAVGTLWKIDATHADHVTRDFYRRTTAVGGPGVARALHDTVRQLRRRVPDRPHIWAAYVHAGA